MQAVERTISKSKPRRCCSVFYTVLLCLVNVQKQFSCQCFVYVFLPLVYFFVVFSINHNKYIIVTLYLDVNHHFFWLVRKATFRIMTVNVIESQIYLNIIYNKSFINDSNVLIKAYTA